MTFLDHFARIDYHQSEYLIDRESRDPRKSETGNFHMKMTFHDASKSEETVHRNFSHESRAPHLRRVPGHSNMADELGSQFSDIKYDLYSTDDDTESHLEMSRRGSHDREEAQNYVLASDLITPRTSDLEHWRSQIPRNGSVDEPVTRPPSVIDGIGSGVSSGACSPVKRSSLAFASSNPPTSKNGLDRSDVRAKPRAGS
jgi:hypothetical protein